MFKVLPQMHRLVSQICETYGVEIAGVIADTEGVKHLSNDRYTHTPYYIVKLAPNERGWTFISCRPIRGKYCDFSASQNNVMVVIYTHTAVFVLPSWRGYIVPPEQMHRHEYHINKGYMPVKVTTDYIEAKYIADYLDAAQ